jgi:hypothetical protein
MAAQPVTGLFDFPDTHRFGHAYSLSKPVEERKGCGQFDWCSNAGRNNAPYAKPCGRKLVPHVLIIFVAICVKDRKDHVNDYIGSLQLDLRRCFGNTPCQPCLLMPRNSAPNWTTSLEPDQPNEVRLEARCR